MGRGTLTPKRVRAIASASAVPTQTASVLSEMGSCRMTTGARVTRPTPTVATSTVTRSFLAVGAPCAKQAEEAASPIAPANIKPRKSGWDFIAFASWVKQEPGAGGQGLGAGGWNWGPPVASPPKPGPRPYRLDI